MKNIIFLVASLFVTAGSLPAGQDAIALLASTSVIPFTIEKHGDVWRPMIDATINGLPLRMIVHSNAGFYAQMVHRDAAAAGIPLLPGRHTTMGIDKPGHVSKLGQDGGTIATLQVGNTLIHDAPASVFELPIGPKERLGMLGIRWIQQNRILIDYANNTMTVAPSAAEAEQAGNRLARDGYVALPMTFDPDTLRYTVSATINGVTRLMAVTTASRFELDTAFAAVARVPLGKQAGHGFGPSGTKVKDYELGAPVSVSIAGWTSPPIITGWIQDEYGYIAERRPADPVTAIGGFLGTSFLQSTGAVIDFGRSILFVRRGK